jgi:hypothetical protein
MISPSLFAATIPCIGGLMAVSIAGLVYVLMLSIRPSSRSVARPSLRK